MKITLFLFVEKKLRNIFFSTFYHYLFKLIYPVFCYTKYALYTVFFPFLYNVHACNWNNNEIQTLKCLIIFLKTLLLLMWLRHIVVLLKVYINETLVLKNKLFNCYTLHIFAAKHLLHHASLIEYVILNSITVVNKFLM